MLLAESCWGDQNNVECIVEEETERVEESSIVALHAVWLYAPLCLVL